MIAKNFDDVVRLATSAGTKKRVALVEARDEHALEAVLLARAQGLVEPVLVGDPEAIRVTARALAAAADAHASGAGHPGPETWDLAGIRIVAAGSEAASAAAGVALVRAGEADFLMKGKLQTADLLRAVVDRESGLRTGSVMSHVAFFALPGKDRLLLMSDGGMLTYPDLAQKRQLIENAVGFLHKLGYDNPLVAVLAAVETPNDKMRECVDAVALKRMNQEGEITGCTVEGPISLDLALDAGIAKIKGYSSPVAGAAELLVVPDLASGNILGKCLAVVAGLPMAGLIAGAAAPIVLTSRGATAAEKYYSLAFAAAVSR